MIILKAMIFYLIKSFAYLQMIYPRDLINSGKRFIKNTTDRLLIEALK